MKTLATLHAEQKEEFDEVYESLRAVPISKRIDGNVEKVVKSSLTTSLLSQIDLMIEIVESKKKDEHPVDCIDGETPVETYGYEAEYNSALSDLSTLLQAQRKLIEEQ